MTTAPTRPAAPTLPAAPALAAAPTLPAAPALAAAPAAPAPGCHYGDLPLRYVARMTVEFTTPLKVSTGRDAWGGAADVVRDANGLPTLPGSGLTGVLRHAFGDQLRAEGVPAAAVAAQVGDIFGPATDADGTASRLSITNGHIHDRTDTPVDGLIDPASPRFDDPVLAHARTPVIRSRVRIGHRGAADGRGKFEDAVVGAGHRFTFDLTLRGTPADAGPWARLLAVLGSPHLRFGGGTRHGYGAFTIVRAKGQAFDLNQPDAFAAYCGLPARLDQPAALEALALPSAGAAPAGLAPVNVTPAGLAPVNVTPTVAAPVNVAPAGIAPVIIVTLHGLRPVTPWLFGGGVPEGNEGFAPVTETLVRWQGNRGAVLQVPTLYLPASGIKGALAHRLAWHYNRRQPAAHADRLASAEELADHCGAGNAAVRTLLGSLPREQATPGRRGWLILDDLFLTPPAAPGETQPDQGKTPTTMGKGKTPAALRSQEVQHVSLDRFAGGARSGLLFAERVVCPEAVHCDYRILLAPPPGADPPDDDIRQALADTLADVQKGRLAFGAGTGRGNGRFRCEAVTWSDGGAWLKTGRRQPEDEKGAAA